MPYATPAGKGYAPWMPYAQMPYAQLPYAQKPWPPPMLPYGWPTPYAPPAEYMSPPPAYAPYFAAGPRAEDLAQVIEPALAGVLPALQGLIEIPLILLEAISQAEVVPQVEAMPQGEAMPQVEAVPQVEAMPQTEPMSQTESADWSPEPESWGWHRPGGFAPGEAAP